MDANPGSRSSDDEAPDTCDLCASQVLKTIPASQKWLDELLVEDVDLGNCRENGEQGSDIDNDKVLLCQRCFGVVSSVMDKHERAVEMEEHVRCLEMQVLEARKELQGIMEGFYGDLKKIKRIVNRRKRGKGLEGWRGVKNRKRVVEVTDDLRDYPKGTNLETCRTSEAVGIQKEPESDEEVEVKQEVVSSDFNESGDEEDLEEAFGRTTEENEDFEVKPEVKLEGFSDNEEEEDVEFEDSNNLEESPEPPSKETTEKRHNYINLHRRLQRNCSLYKASSLATASMPPFTRQIIQGVMRREAIRQAMAQENVPRQRKYSKEVEGPQLHYDTEKKVLLVDNVEVVVNEHLKSLHCSQCSYFQKREDNKLQDKKAHWKGLSHIRNHILGRHLKQFKCKFCGVYLSCHPRDHEKICAGKINQEEGGLLCDICGQEFKQAKRLKWHRWNHLSEEEKAEELRNGRGPPEPVKRREREEPVACPKCGKLFGWRATLKIHEERHCPSLGKIRKKPNKPRNKISEIDKVKRVGPMVTCRKGCGKTFSKGGGRTTHEKRCGGPGSVIKRGRPKKIKTGEGKKSGPGSVVKRGRPKKSKTGEDKKEEGVETKLLQNEEMNS